VPDVTIINSDAQPELNWASRTGASSLPSVGYLGITVPVAVPRVRGRVVFITPPQPDAGAKLLGQTNIHNYMTSASAAGEGASGPPPYREPV
jgi:hypothetical protein